MNIIHSTFILKYYNNSAFKLALPGIIWRIGILLEEYIYFTWRIIQKNVARERKG